jgi:hypothetical protein
MLISSRYQQWITARLISVYGQRVDLVGEDIYSSISELWSDLTDNYAVIACIPVNVVFFFQDNQSPVW